MIDHLPKYHKPIKRKYYSFFNEKYWDQSIKSYDENAYKKSIIELFRYMESSNITNKQMKKQDSKFTIQHGAINMHITIEKDNLNIYVPLLKRNNDTKMVPFLRKVTELNFSEFHLVQMIYEDNSLFIKYDEKLPLCKPIKLYWIIHEIAIRSDKYCHFFKKNYNLDYLEEPSHELLSNHELISVQTHIKEIMDELKQYIDNFKSNQKDEYIWDIITISFLKLHNMPYMNGYLKYELYDIINIMYDSNFSIKYRVDKSINFIEESLGISSNEIEANLYHCNKAVDVVLSFKPSNISNLAIDNISNIQKYNSDKNFTALSYFLVERFLRIGYDYNLNKSYQEGIENVLKTTSSMHYDRASKILEKFNDRLVQKEIHEEVNINTYLLVIGIVIILLILRQIV